MIRKKCEECGGRIIRKKIDFVMYGINLGKFPAEVCQKCGEEVFDEEVSDQIEVIAKKKELWGLEAKTKVGISGTTLDIKFPQKLIRFFGLEKGKEAVIKPKDKHSATVDFV